MDHNLREIGISDTTLAKKMQKIGEAFYGRAAAYDKALSTADDAALAAALERNVFGTHMAPAAARLASYVRTAAEGSAGSRRPVSTVAPSDFPIRLRSTADEFGRRRGDDGAARQRAVELSVGGR